MNCGVKAAQEERGTEKVNTNGDSKLGSLPGFLVLLRKEKVFRLYGMGDTQIDWMTEVTVFLY